MQYADLAQWLREMFDDEDAAEGLGFWRGVALGELSNCRLALERPASNTVSDGPTLYGRRAISMPAAALQDAAERHGVEPSTILFGLAIGAIAFAMYLPLFTLPAAAMYSNL